MSTEKPPFVETIHKILWSKSSNPFAEENINDQDFQNGYQVGEVSEFSEELHSKEWIYAWVVTYKETHSPQWQSWKRGYHAARLARVTLK